MRIIYNSIIPVKGFVAIMLFGFIFARIKYKPLPDSTIYHEQIHIAQAKECGGYLKYYLLYLYYWIGRGYKRIPFEQEAKEYMIYPNYLTVRKPFAWKSYI